MSKVTDLIEELKTLEATGAELAEQITMTRNLIMQEMQTEGLTQVKTKNETVTIAKRVSYSVNEFEWRAWAKEQPDLELDMFYVSTLDKKRVTDQAESWLKKTGEIVPGIEPRETEYLSIRKPTAKK